MNATTRTVTLTPDQHLHAIIAVMTQLRADRGAKRTPGDEYDKFLIEQIATGTETLTALNAATPESREETRGALDGENLKTAIDAMHYMLRVGRGERWACLGIPSHDALNAALLFLENPK